MANENNPWDASRGLEIAGQLRKGAPWLRCDWFRGDALHPSFAGGRKRIGDRSSIGWLVAWFRLTDGGDAVAGKRCLDVRYGKKDRATDATETDDAGGLPCTEGATADPNDARGFVRAQIQPRHRRRRVLLSNCCQPVHIATRELVGPSATAMVFF